MAEEHSVSPSAQPAVGTGEDRDQVIGRLFALPFEQQVEVLRAVAPLILVRTLGAAEARRYLDSLRTATAGTEKLSIPELHQPSDPPDKVAGDILRQPLGDQQHILNIVSPRIVGELLGGDRFELLDDIEREMVATEQGTATTLEGPIS
jgi:hypothetical protein